MRPQTISLSSGDLIADRRFEWARGLMEVADFTAASGLLLQVLDLVPDFAAAWFMLGQARERLGARAGAIHAFEKARAADPRDALGAVVQLTRLGVMPPVAMPAGYIQALFDGYAPRFDEQLIRKLGYRGPELLLFGVKRARSQGTFRFENALDLGCGTGLAGQLFRPVCKHMTGVDLSAGMLAEADGKGIYDRVVEAEAMAFLDDEASAGACYDLIVAADVFVYFHELAQVPEPARAVLAPGGLLAFSVETHEGEGVILRDTLRYAHAADYVRDVLTAGGMKVVGLESASARSENGVPVPGLMVVATV